MYCSHVYVHTHTITSSRTNDLTSPPIHQSPLPLFDFISLTLLSNITIICFVAAKFLLHQLRDLNTTYTQCTTTYSDLFAIAITRVVHTEFPLRSKVQESQEEH